MNLDKHIWEGWRVKDFVADLQPVCNMIMAGNSWQKPFTNKKKPLRMSWKRLLTSPEAAPLTRNEPAWHKLDFST